MKRKKWSRSLFLKIFSLNLAIILSSFLIISLISYPRLSGYLKGQHISNIMTASSKIFELSKQKNAMLNDLESFSGAMPQPNFMRLKGQIMDGYNSSMSIIASSTNFSVMDVSSDGQILFRHADIKIFEDEIILKSDDGNEHINPAYFEDLTKDFDTIEYGGEKYFVSFGNAKNMFKTTTLMVVKPVYTNAQVSSYLILFIPTPQITLLLNVFFSNFILSALISLVVSMILSYALSYRISKPLKDMNKVAMKLASGDFSMRVTSDTSNKISEIDELIKTFNDMADAIKDAEMNNRAFVASVAHELRTPMTSIIGFIDSILDGTIPKEKSGEYLEICLSEARRLSRLVNEIMDATGLENGTKRIEKEDFNINECIRRQIIKYEDRISEKNLSVALFFDTEDCYCLCDKDAITRVFENLIDNAIKFTNEGGNISIHVNLHGTKANISIKNTGDGIEEADLKHIFEKFYKSDKSRGLDKKGIGLGLYIIKNILLLHDEPINAESKVGEYTKFNFALPLSKNK